MSEVIILDTHIWFWIITQDFKRFPEVWQKDIETASKVGISVISCYEIALAEKKGRIVLPCPILDWFADAIDPSGIDLFPISSKIAIRAVNLSPIHKDPFDRLIIATALEHNAKLASMDGLFAQYPELKNCLLKSQT
jgi:PIN domain nuclease of toxin-antitoxin system